MIHVAMRDRDAGIGEPADPRRDAGDDAEGNAGFDQRQRLLAAAPEDEGVAALQPADAFSLSRELHQPERDVALAGRRLAAALARIFDRRAFSRMRQHALVDQRVVDHHVSLAKRIQGVERQEARVARPGADQPYPARLEDR